MVTEFGKVLRKLRIDMGMTLKMMADKLCFSSSYLSALETGKKNINTNVVSEIVQKFKLNDEEAIALQDAADISNGEIKLNLSNVSLHDQEGILLFARKYSDLDDTVKTKIRNMLNE